MSERKRSRSRRSEEATTEGYHETEFKGHKQFTCDHCGASFIMPDDENPAEIQAHLREHDVQFGAAERGARRQVVSPLVDAQGKPFTHTVTITTPPAGGEIVTPAEETPEA